MSSLTEYSGPSLPFYFLILVNCIGTFRSFVHVFYHDGGAYSFAGMPLDDKPCSKNLVSIYGQWGASQMVQAFIAWAVVLHYRALVPIMVLAYTMELFLRVYVAHTKKIVTVHTPPGAIGNRILLPVAVIMCIMLFWK